MRLHQAQGGSEQRRITHSRSSCYGRILTTGLVLLAYAVYPVAPKSNDAGSSHWRVATMAEALEVGR